MRIFLFAILLANVAFAARERDFTEVCGWATAVCYLACYDRVKRRESK